MTPPQVLERKLTMRKSRVADTKLWVQNLTKGKIL
jgi:hypothetical protein